MMHAYVQIVSDDGKKVRRRQPFTEKHKEELQVNVLAYCCMHVLFQFKFIGRN